MLINDISDHLPIFIITNPTSKSNNLDIGLNYRHIRSVENITALQEDLIERDWNAIYEIEETNEAYEHFLKIFTSIYNKNCPIQQYSRGNSQKTKENPWITAGILRACRKKNKLYKNFIKKRTKEAEIRYKQYKNKLTSIMRISKKDYYKKLIQNSKGNVKGMWNILNSIIKSKCNYNSYPKYFIESDEEIDNLEDAAHRFNKFFANVGPDLAAKIPEQKKGEGSTAQLIDVNAHSMFLQPVDEMENVVQKFKNKRSTDYKDLDMTLIKDVIHTITKPLVHICNLSFSTGTFPNSMKIAKVIPLFEAGSKHLFTNYRPVSL